MVSHGPSTHDFNPVASKEINKIEKVVKDSLNDMDYSENVSEFFRVENEGAKIGAQYFDNNLLMLATFSPKGFDDIDFGVGLAIMNQAKSSCGVENVILVDCHNCFKGEGGRVLPGNKEVFELMGAAQKIKAPQYQYKMRVGCAGDPMDKMSKEEGIGDSGIKVMVLEAYGFNKTSQKTAYILLDSNNMLKGFREKIIEKVLGLGLDHAEVMTTDTHFVNTLSGGHNPVGKKKQDQIIESILKCTEDAIIDLEEVSIGFKVSHIEGIKTLGPTQATELVTTISSIVAVSRIFAPLIFILAFLFAFIWIFYWAF
jgi:putative membrane protein